MYLTHYRHGHIHMSTNDHGGGLVYDTYHPKRIVAHLPLTLCLIASCRLVWCFVPR
jgi:hypothetical protein